MTTRSIGTYKPAEATAKKVDAPSDSKPKGPGWSMTPEEEAIFERAKKMKAESQSMILQSQATRKQLGGNLKDHFKFLLVMGPTELEKEIKARFKAWDSDGGGYLDKAEMSQAMEEMGKKPTPEELEALMKEVDLDGNGTVDLGEFSHMIRKQLDIGHTCNCTYCENKRKEEEAADAVAVAAEAAADKKPPPKKK